MNHQKQLLEFLCKFIDIQIKKYESLATVGIGPDARLNARLVLNEVDELLDLTEQLLAETELSSNDNVEFINIFNQVKFYIEQEYVRSYAGWLLAENNIHSTVKERVSEQLNELLAIAKLIGLNTEGPSSPITLVQKQCKYDSCAISYKILDLALKIRDNPQHQFDGQIPPHALMVMKTNATSRYVTYSDEIEALHHKYENYLNSSGLEKSSTLLQGNEAREYQQIHLARWNNILGNYKKSTPDSCLFSSEHEWYNIGVNKQPPSILSGKNVLFCAKVTGFILISMLLKYFTQTNEQILNVTQKF